MIRRLEGMSSAHICSSCRLRMTHLRKERVLQWYQRATFISLATPNVPNDTKGMEKGKEEETNRGKGSKQPPRIGRQDGWPQFKRTRNKYPGFSAEAGDVLESLFEESVRSPPPTSIPTSPPSKQPRPYKDVNTLNEMLADGPTQLPAAWKFCLEHFSPDLTRKAPRVASLPVFISHSVYRLIRQLVQAKKHDPFSSDLPSATEISRVCLAWGVMRSRDWIELMYGLLDGLTKAEQADLPEYMHELDEILIDDLLGSWNLMARKADIPVGNPSPLLDWAHVPQFSSRDVERGIEKEGAVYGFGYLIPSRNTSNLSGLVVVALATFLHINNEVRTSNGVAASAYDLNSALASIIHNVEIDNSLLHVQPQAPRTLVELVEKNWPDIKSTAARIVSREVLNSPAPTAPGRNIAPYNRVKLGSRVEPERATASVPFRRGNIVFVNKSLHDAWLRRDYNLVNKLWDEVVEWPTSTEPAPSDTATTKKSDPAQNKAVHGSKNMVTSTLCNYFIMVYMGLRQAHRAIDVWNFMVSKDIAPNLETWNSLLQGCKLAGNWEGIENVWARMLSMDVKPDEILWVSRISGLMTCRQIEMGVGALEQMGGLWLESAKAQYGDIGVEELRKKEVKNALKPTIAAVNAAIYGILKHPQPQEALVQKLLTWAAKLGLQPDIITYNTLLRPLARQGRLEEAFGILKMMQNQGIKADIATFTTILDETFRNADQMSPDEQRDMVRGTFAEMEALGVKANLHTYGKMIYHLLQSRSGDVTVANAVMDTMARQGLKPSASIYTMLVGHYFHQDPPDLEGVRGVIERARREVGRVDYIFWDRVVEEYARIGDTVTAVELLRQHDATGNRIGYRALQTLLIALAKREEWEVAKSIVKDVKEQQWAQATDANDISPQKRTFWTVVAELGLLEGET